MPQYTPFLTSAAQAIGKGYFQGQQNKLISDAYMGMPGAMEQLMQINPQAAQKIRSERVSQEQRDIQGQRFEQQRATEETRYAEQQNIAAQQRQTSGEDRMRKIAGENREYVENTLTNAAKMPTFEEASAYVDRRIERHQAFKGQEGFKLTPEVYGQYKQLAGGQKAPFAGTGMEAQINNMLVKGVNDPSFRDTPQYAAAWQKANEPTIVRSPTGDIVQPKTMDPQFKPPGPEAVKEPIPPEQALTQPTEGAAPGEIKFVPGTRKISSDQKAYNKDYILLKKSFDSMQNYISTLNRLGPQMSIGPINAQDYQLLESSYARAMLDAKETNNLGVLNGPDIGIIRKLMGDPTGFMGASGMIKGKESLLTGAQEAKKQITDNFKSLNELMGEYPSVKLRQLPQVEATPTGGPTPGTVVEGYKFKGGDPSKEESWEKI